MNVSKTPNPHVEKRKSRCVRARSSKSRLEFQVRSISQGQQEVTQCALGTHARVRLKLLEQSLERIDSRRAVFGPLSIVVERGGVRVVLVFSRVEGDDEFNHAASIVSCGRQTPSSRGTTRRVGAVDSGLVVLFLTDAHTKDHAHYRREDRHEHFDDGVIEEALRDADAALDEAAVILDHQFRLLGFGRQRR